MAATTGSNSPHSSPPEVNPALLYLSDIDKFDDGTSATYQGTGNFPWQMEWPEALGYAEYYYTRLRAMKSDPITRHKACLAAALVGWYQEILEDENNNPLVDAQGNYVFDPAIKSVLWFGSIPKGQRRNELANGGHPRWRQHCWHWIEEKKKGEKTGKLVSVEGPKGGNVHAEDVVHNMMESTLDSEWGRRQRWVDGSFYIVIFGVQPRMVQRRDRSGRPVVDWLGRPIYDLDTDINSDPTEPGQVWPCGPNPHGRPDSKKPSCQAVLDRRGIQWRFGIIPPKEPTPEPQLPQYPPGWTGGGGGEGSGSGGHSGGGDHPASGYYEPPPPSSDYGSDPDWDVLDQAYTRAAAGTSVQQGEKHFGAAAANMTGRNMNRPGSTPVRPHSQRRRVSKREMDSALASLKKLTLAARGSSRPDAIIQVKPAAGAAPAKAQQQQQQQQQVAGPQQKVAASQQNGAKKQPVQSPQGAATSTGPNPKTLLPHAAAHQPHGIASPARTKPANLPAVVLPAGQQKPVNAQGAAAPQQQTKPAKPQGPVPPPPPPPPGQRKPANPQSDAAPAGQKNSASPQGVVAKMPVNPRGVVAAMPVNPQGVVAKIPVNPQDAASSARKKLTLPPRITTQFQQGDAPVAPSPKTALPKAPKTPKFLPKTPTVQVTA
ncbi:hypothetical protein C8A00DRAFT_38840 [Chaetomidium leptoderma]|uniref:Uncharacterized protein n=1 Tax=Chaetomidium leptoderma TaxID=669021 RepID=A0AAN6ZTN4_9PEZI|nr:hypothetical protein C8A00DRAFT_38840 [Chaetomidium leptoderma]